MYLPNLRRCDLVAVDTYTNAGSLSQALTELLLTKEEVSHGCATRPRKDGIEQLDPNRLHAIRG